MYTQLTTSKECHDKKVKCVMADGAPCDRCLKMGLDCKTVSRATRKRSIVRMRSTTRIKELEINNIILERTIDRMPIPSADTPMVPAMTQQLTPPPPQLSPPQHQPLPPLFLVSVGDPFAIGAIDDAESELLYTVFHDNYAPVYPLISPPPPQRWRDVRAEKPALFRAALATASSTVRPHTWELRFEHTKQYLVHEIMILDNLSLDLIQGILILATWSYPPKALQSFNFTRMVDMAAKAVLDLRCSGAVEYTVPCVEESPEGAPFHDIELCRTYLATYFLSSR